MEEKEKIERAIKLFLSKEENQEVVVRTVLENMFWPSIVNTDKEYFVREDDCDGERKGISVYFLSNGDGVVNMENTFHIKSNSDYGKNISSPHVYRFRNRFEGGQKPLVYGALLVLATAVAMDPEEEIDIQRT